MIGQSYFLETINSLGLMAEVEKAGAEPDLEELKHGRQMTWLNNMLESAMKLCRRALPAGMHVRLFSSLMPPYARLLS